jgi:hypothetical protein
MSSHRPQHEQGDAGIALHDTPYVLRHLQRGDQRPQCWRGLTPARVIEMKTGIGRAPVRKHPDKLAGCDLIRHIMFHDVSKTGARTDGGGRQVAVIGDERPVRVDPDLLAVLP